MRFIAGLLNKRNMDVLREMSGFFPSDLGDHEFGISIGDDILTIGDLNEVDESLIHGDIGIGYCQGENDSHKTISLMKDTNTNHCLLYGRTWHSDELTNSQERIKSLDGSYVLAMRQGSKILLSKDKVGVKQVFYGEGPEFVGFSSRKEPLMSLSIDPIRMLPGEVLELSKKGVNQISLSSLKKPRANLRNEDKALELYKKSLREAVRRRIEDVDKVGIIFSGGVDSALIGKVASMIAEHVLCYCTGAPSSPDMIAAKVAAKSMDLPIRVTELSTDKLEKVLPHVIKATESWNQLQIEAAVPVYCSMEMASKEGVSVVLNGQGADELFAGYDWYPRVLKEKGRDSLVKHMWEDLMLAYKETFERENKMAEFHDLELRVPYCDEDVIRTAMSIPIRMKTRGDAVIGKRLHRRASEDLGVPVSIAWREKDAAQHGSGVTEMIKTLARRNGFDESGNYETIGGVEKSGSVYRYGNLYRDEEEKYGDDFVQAYLKEIAHKLGTTGLSGG